MECVDLATHNLKSIYHRHGHFVSAKLAERGVVFCVGYNTLLESEFGPKDFRLSGPLIVDEMVRHLLTHKVTKLAETLIGHSNTPNKLFLPSGTLASRAGPNLFVGYNHTGQLSGEKEHWPRNSQLAHVLHSSSGMALVFQCPHVASWTIRLFV
jgi:hypothetical protein